MKTFEWLELNCRDENGSFRKDADRQIFYLLCEEIDKLKAQVNKLTPANQTSVQPSNKSENGK